MRSQIPCRQVVAAQHAFAMLRWHRDDEAFQLTSLCLCDRVDDCFVKVVEVACRHPPTLARYLSEAAGADYRQVLLQRHEFLLVRVGQQRL